MPIEIIESIGLCREFMPEEQTNPHQSYSLIILWVIISYIVGSSLVHLLVSTFFSNKIILTLSTSISQFMFLLLPTLLLSKKVNIPFKDIFKLNFNFKLLHLIPAFIGLMGIQLFASGFSELQQYILPEMLQDVYKQLQESIREQYLSIIVLDSIPQLLISIFAIAVTPAICEELFFRGLFQQSLEQSSGYVKAILLSSFVFAIIHLNPIDFVPLFVIGAFLATLVYVSGSIIPAILVHFLNNTIATVVLFYEHNTSTDISTVEPMNAIIYLLMGTFFIGLSFHLLLKNHNLIENVEQ